MKRIVTVVFIMLILSGSALAQRGGNHDRIRAAKIAYIAHRMRLSPSQSANFTPLYDNFEKEKKAARMYFLQKYKGISTANADDSTSRQIIDDNLDYQQKVIELRRKYNEQFLKVISLQQLAELNKAERDFKEILIKRLERQRGPGGFNGRRRGGY